MLTILGIMPTARFSFTDGVILALYLLGMLGVGALVAARVRTFADYVVVGRRMTTPGGHAGVHLLRRLWPLPTRRE